METEYGALTVNHLWLYGYNTLPRMGGARIRFTSMTKVVSIISVVNFYEYRNRTCLTWFNAVATSQIIKYIFQFIVLTQFSFKNNDFMQDYMSVNDLLSWWNVR